ncbi:MAG: hypothetical protein R8G34_18115 [Paracoccaceae bacterium]|nr:hypothetical protein [Paracoccaceae bacterium]
MESILETDDPITRPASIVLEAAHICNAKTVAINLLPFDRSPQQPPDRERRDSFITPIRVGAR